MTKPKASKAAAQSALFDTTVEDLSDLDLVTRSFDGDEEATVELKSRGGINFPVVDGKMRAPNGQVFTLWVNAKRELYLVPENG